MGPCSSQTIFEQIKMIKTIYDVKIFNINYKHYGDKDKDNDRNPFMIPVVLTGNHQVRMVNFTNSLHVQQVN